MIIGFIIAGGMSSRMGGRPKCLLEVDGKSILNHIIERFEPQVDQLVLNTNEPPALFESFALPVIADTSADYEGPLAGLLTCFEYAAQNTPDAEWIATVPSDCPFLPKDLIARLLASSPSCDAVVAASGDEIHPLAALWRPGLLLRLQQAFESDGMRGMKQWTAQLDAAQVMFPTEPYDPFFNVNEPEDLARAKIIARGS